MTTKLAITITPDSDILSPEQMDRAMLRTIHSLAQLGLMPLRKITIAVECKDEGAEQIEDAIDAALSGQPVGIEVALKVTRERHVTRVSHSTSTPMDGIEGFADALRSSDLVGSDRPPVGVR